VIIYIATSVLVLVCRFCAPAQLFREEEEEEEEESV